MPQIVQLNIFGEQEPVPVAPTGYAGFTAKFEPKRTTDDCYTPPAVFEAVRRYVDEHIIKLDGLEVLRPFKPGGDYLAENYGENTVVIDNPPFSLYSRIVRNYCAMGVRFFLFAPALTLFVPKCSAQYVITRSVITYANGAKILTAFVTNLLPAGVNVRLSGILSQMLAEAQRKPQRKLKTEKPRGLYSSADLKRFVMDGSDKDLAGSGEFVEKVAGVKIFGKAMKFNEAETDLLTQMDKQNGRY